jgi:hypothetical protein
MLISALVIVGTIATFGDSVATAVVHLDTVASPTIGVHAYDMSIGPPGPWTPDTTRSGGFTLVMEHCRFLRVTLYNSEGYEQLTIDDISRGHGDSREITAQYALPVYPGLGELWIRPERAGMLRPLDGPPEVHWLGPEAFFVPYHEDTLFVERLRGDEFKIRVSARMEYVGYEEYHRILDSLRVHSVTPGWRPER